MVVLLKIVWRALQSSWVLGSIHERPKYQDLKLQFSKMSHKEWKLFFLLTTSGGGRIWTQVLLIGENSHCHWATRLLAMFRNPFWLINLSKKSQNFCLGKESSTLSNILLFLLLSLSLSLTHTHTHTQWMKRNPCPLTKQSQE